jgi:hypothetical protein
MADREYLSLFAEWADGDDSYFVKNYPTYGERMREDVALSRLTAEGWRLTTISAAYAHRRHVRPGRILYLERTVTSASAPTTSTVIRLLTEDGRVEPLRAIAQTAVGKRVITRHGLHLSFLGITRLTRGRPVTALLGQTRFTADPRSAMTGLISLNGSRVSADTTLDEIYCQFLAENLDGTFSAEYHVPERLPVDPYGLIVGVPFGSARLEARHRIRVSRYEYVVFMGSEELRSSAEILVRHGFEIVS